MHKNDKWVFIAAWSMKIKSKTGKNLNDHGQDEYINCIVFMINFLGDTEVISNGICNLKLIQIIPNSSFPGSVYTFYSWIFLVRYRHRKNVFQW